MNGQICLDANVVIRCLRGDEDLKTRLRTYSRRSISLFVLGELLLGAKASANPPKQLDQVGQFCRTVDLVFPDSATAEAYAQVRYALRLMGKPIPQNDYWIAAICLQHSLPLATGDAHFRHVPSLKLISF